MDGMLSGTSAVTEGVGQDVERGTLSRMDRKNITRRKKQMTYVSMLVLIQNSVSHSS